MQPLHAAGDATIACQLFRMATAKQVQSGATTVDFLRIIACSFSFFGFPERAFLFSSRECLWVINVEAHAENCQTASTAKIILILWLTSHVPVRAYNTCIMLLSHITVNHCPEVQSALGLNINVIMFFIIRYIMVTVKINTPASLGRSSEPLFSQPSLKRAHTTKNVVFFLHSSRRR